MFDDFWNKAGGGSLYQDVCQVAGDMVEDIYNKYDNAEALWDYFYSVEYPFGEFED